jgi:putative ABC transport system permease protein
VLGLSARQRRGLVLAECAVLGAAGALLGLLAGAAMAAAALRWLAGDLGGGYFPGIAPRLQVGGLGVAVFFALGLVSALVGGWWPARQAEQLAPAQALKGLGSSNQQVPPAWPGWRCWPRARLPRWRRRCSACRWRPTRPWRCCWWAAWR